ncbi:MAG: DUF1932 domain-containing protein [Variovorax sp.]
MSPGDMGQAVASQLQASGFTVCTALDKRSKRSCRLAAQAGLVNLGSLARLAAECDIVLSIMNPGEAFNFSQEIASVLAPRSTPLVFVDCNAVAPVTMQSIDTAVTKAGAICVDGSIIGAPPRGTAVATLYLSGPDAEALEQLHAPLLNVHCMSDRVGDASALKMCYGSINKGIQALVLEALIVARRLGVESELETQLVRSRPELHKWVLASLPAMPPKAYRWTPEMTQIAKTFEDAGMTRRVFDGASDVFQFVASTPLGRESPEERDRSRTGKDVVRLLADLK